MTADRASSLTLAALALAVLAAACGERGGGDRPPTEATMQTRHDDPATREQLLAADRAFAADVSAATGRARARAWAAWFARDGRQLVPRAVVAGRDEIRDLMDPAFADTAFSLRWEPDLAAGADGWGWTSGRYVATAPGPDGPVRREGRYLTVWQRQPDGAWLVAVDTGVPDGD